MERKWMTTTAAILDIISGISGIICGLILIILAIAGGLFMEYLDASIPPFILTVVFLLAGIPYLILGALTVTGGIYCLRRNNWGMALTGAITSLFIIQFLGIASIVFTILSRKEFNSSS